MRHWFFEQLAMYAAYHRDTKNQITHHVGVPMIVFALMLAGSTVTLINTSAGPVSLAAVLMSAVLIVYLIGAPLVGTIAVLLYGALLYGADYLALTQPGNVLWLALGLFILGWIIQFVGHIFEGRKPALFDNLLQIFMAPAFLIAEVLFAFGLENGLHAEINARMPRYMAHGEKGEAT